MESHIRTAVIPVAGNGSRIRPLSLVMPKEMLATPYGPIIELITNELIDAGIEQIIYVTKPGKELIEKHLKAVTLNKHPAGKSVSLEFINQNDLSGNGGAILTAVHEKDLTEPFIVVWGDEIFIKKGSVGRVGELISAFSKVGKPCIMLTEVSNEDIPKCGMAFTRAYDNNSRLLKVTDLVEKPSLWPAEKNYASVGGYIINSEIIELLAVAKKSNDGELYLSQAISDYLQDNRDLFGVLTECEWYETGSMDGYVSAFAALAQKHRRDATLE